MTKPEYLHLKGQTPEDLEVISGAVQDAIMRVEGIIYDAKARSVTLGLQRFRHEVSKPSRIMSALRFDDVLSVKSVGIDRSKKDAFLVLLSINYEENKSPGGELTLNFAGNGQILLELDCLEVMLLDQGRPWVAKATPVHDV